MIDENDRALTEELVTSLHATAASTPRTADPYGPLGTAIARDRKRRTTIGSLLAVVAVVGAAVGISGEMRHGGTASAQAPGSGVAVAAGTTSPPAPPSTSTSPTKHGAAPNSPSGPPPLLTTTTSQAMMLGWPTDYSLFPGYTTSTSQAAPTVDAMVHAYGKPVDDGTRNVLANLVGSFKLCGYQLDSYHFTLRWAGDLAHSGGQGAAVVDVSHGGATYRMVGFNSYKGVWLQLPTAIDASEASHVEAVPLPELDQPAQTMYAAVVAAPGSQVTISGTEEHAPGTSSTPFHTDSVTVGSSGVAEVKLTSPGAEGLMPYPTITAVTIIRPDGTSAAAPLVGGTSAAQEQSARELLPANTVCPGLTPETSGAPSKP